MSLSPELVLETFTRLRRSGFQLGIDELLAGLRLVGQESTGLPWQTDQEALQQALKLLWCNSQSEQSQFEPIWQRALEAIEVRIQTVFEDSDFAAAEQESMPPASVTPPPARTETVSAQDPGPPLGLDTAVQPVRAPFTPTDIGQPSDLQSYWPVSRRSMSYGWRYLRRTVAEGPAEILDVAATVQKAALQGFYLEPVMARRKFNRAQLLLLIDQNGSMMPLHQFTREIAETALYESNLPEGQVTVCYFQNAPADYVYQDTFLSQPVELQSILSLCDGDTSVLIVSDGGAARGYRRLERIRATARFIKQLQRITQRYAWLNPIPFERWASSSAEMIASLVPMFQMDEDGLGNAIDVVRGLQPQVR